MKTHKTTGRYLIAMKGLLAILIIGGGCFSVGCDELGEITGNGNQAPAIRFLGFDIAEIPSDMSDETAVALSRQERSNRLAAGATTHYFPTSDSVDLPFSNLLANRVIVTPPGSSSAQGAIRIIGGKSSERIPVDGVPQSLLIDGIGAGTAGSVATGGSWELTLGEDLVLTGSSTRGDHHAITLEDYNETTTYATGTFSFIVRNREDPNDNRRWIIYNGEFGLAAR